VPDCTFEGEPGQAVKRPDVVGEALSDAEEQLEAVGLQLEVVGGSGRVVEQSPAARTWACVGTVVQVRAEP
jgi:hypothetical protein